MTENNIDQTIETANQLENETISFLQDLVRTPSVNPPGNYKAIYRLLTNYYESIGWIVDTIWTPEAWLDEHDLNYPRPNLLVYPWRNDSADVTIGLHSHLDTVPVQDEGAWSFDPFGAEIHDGKLYGRGSSDEKSVIADATLAARILEERDRIPDNVNVVIMIDADEEIGGETGAKFVAESGAIIPDYVIAQGIVTPAHCAAGINRFTVTVDGVAAHAAFPTKGANALVGLSRIVIAIDEYAESLHDCPSEVVGIKGPTCTPSTMESGVKTNVVPSRAILKIDQRVPPDFDNNALKREVESVIEGVDLPDGVTVNIKRTLASKPWHNDRDSAHVRIIENRIEDVFGERKQAVGIPGSTDIRYYAEKGAKCVHFSAGDLNSNIHGVDEHVKISQVIRSGAVKALAILDIADYYSK